MKVERALTVVGVVLLLAVGAGAEASEASRMLVDQGRELLAQGDYEKAVTRFEFATRSDREDGEAHFFLGVGYNRLGNGGEALTWLKRARDLGYVHDDQDLEEGVALVGLGAFEPALPPLGRFLTAHPDSAIAKELLGRAYFGLKRDDEAEPLLRAAAEADPRLADTAGLLLALIAERRDREAGALDRYFRDVLRRDPTTPLAQAIHAGRLPQESGEDRKPWAVAVTLGGGYNDNVVALGEGVALPAGISNEAAGFLRATLDARYRGAVGKAGRFTLGYAAQGDAYERELDDFDLLDQTIYARYRHSMSERLSLELAASDRFTFIGGERFRNLFALSPGLSYRLNAWSVGELSYSFSVGTYYFDSAASQDRDGIANAVSAGAYVRVPDTRLRLRAGYFLRDVNTDGSDFDLLSHGPYLSLGYDFISGIVGELYYSHTFNNYDNANTLSATGRSRNDDVDQVTLQITIPVKDDVKAFVRFDHVNNASNIGFYDYDQNVISAGLSLRF